MKKKINMQFIIVSFIAIILTMSLSVGTFYELFVQEMRNDMKAYTHVLRSAGVFNASNEEKLNLKNEDLRITIIDADGTVVYVAPAFPVTRKTASFETATGSLSRNSIILLYSLAEMIALRDSSDSLYHRSKAAS